MGMNATTTWCTCVHDAPGVVTMPHVGCHTCVVLGAGREAQEGLLWAAGACMCRDAWVCRVQCRNAR